MPKRAAAAAVSALLLVSLLALAASPVAARSGGARWPPGMENCSGATAIVVASDPAAQSDVHSAVTLAGVLDTECLVDAGARTAPMPAASVGLLDSADENVYVVGGTAAVPDAKLRGRNIVNRVGGADRWATARLAGSVAQDIARANPPTSQTVNAAAFSAVSGVGRDGCGLRNDGSIACWRWNYETDTVVAIEPPVSGTFSAINGFWYSGCGLRNNSSIACWHWNYETDAAVAIEPPVSGTFSAINGDAFNGCGLRNDSYLNGLLACWHLDRHEIEAGYEPPFEPPLASVNAISGSGQYRTGCALRVHDGSLACWQKFDSVSAAARIEMPVSGTFSAVSGDVYNGCASRTLGGIACWRWNNGTRAAEAFEPPVSGTFSAVSIEDPPISRLVVSL